jgi:hypothetical protein
MRRVPGTSRLERVAIIGIAEVHRTDMPAIELDATTFHLLIRLARTWRVSKEQAVVRALEQANVFVDSRDLGDRLEAFHELKRRLDLTPAKAAEWQDAVLESRR